MKKIIVFIVMLFSSIFFLNNSAFSQAPPCPAGVKLWLGYTDDWGTASNWCGGTLPTINDVVLIDEVNYLGGTQSGAPFDPVIHSGTVAAAKTIRISSSDTLRITATNASSLTIADSLTIGYNGSAGKLLIQNSPVDTIQVGNGSNPLLVSPFMGNKRNGRMQLIYTKNELLSYGLKAGDKIDQFLFHIRLRATTSPVVSYSGFTIKYATVDSTWAGWPFGNPTTLAPNTSPYVTIFGPSTVTMPMAAGTAGDLTLNLTQNMYWNGVSNLVVEFCFDNSIVPLGSNQDQVWQTQIMTPGFNSTMWLTNIGGPNVSGCVLNWPISGSTAAFGTQFRPNITFHVNKTIIDTIQAGNGTETTLITPFIGNKRNGRMQLVYTKNELLGFGFKAGDNIDQFIFHIRLRASIPVVSYGGFTIKYATVDSTWGGWPIATPTTLAPNTSPYVTVFGPSTVTLPMAAGTAGNLTLSLSQSMYWNGVSNLVIEMCYDNSTLVNGNNVDQLYQTQVNTPGFNSTMWLHNNGSPTVSGCALNWPISGSTQVFASQFRPNITFHINRPHNTFNIYMKGNGGTTAGHWVNNGTFDAGNSNVIFNNNQLNQSIAGTSTAFYKLTVDKSGPGKKLTLYQYTQVVSSLVLNAGILELNKNTLSINNPAASGITRVSGGIMSETAYPPYGTVSWNIGTNKSVHRFPFISASSNYIPFNITLNSGNVGVYSASTYPTSGKIKPYPTGVNNVNDTIGNNDSAYTVRRFWILDKTGPGGNADLKFSYKNTEAPAPIVKSNLKANRYEYTTDLWQRFTLPVSTSVGANVSSVTISNVTGNPLTSAVWALSDGTHPLRIEMEEQPYAAAYPNPFNESFIVSWDESEPFELFIYDIDGRKVYEKRVSSGEMIAPGNLIRGVYIVELKSSNNIERFRMIKTEKSFQLSVG